MKIAVTGGSGGIGRAITKLALERGHSVVSIDHVAAQGPGVPFSGNDAQYLVADATDYGQMIDVFDGCDAVIHMAAIPSAGRHPDHVIHNTNVVASYNMLRAASVLGIRRICQASSVNAIGQAFSRNPRFDYFPLDEEHPNYSEEPYSLSKWICEQQADSFARRYEDMSIASMRFHWVVPERAMASANFNPKTDIPGKHLWAYTLFESAADACLLSLDVDWKGSEAFYITAPDTTIDVPSLELAAKYFPDVPITGNLSGYRSFHSAAKAERLLGWTHPVGRESGSLD